MKFASNKFSKISFVGNMYLPMLFINDTMLIITIYLCTRYNYKESAFSKGNFPGYILIERTSIKMF